MNGSQLLLGRVCLDDSIIIISRDCAIANDIALIGFK